MARKPRALLDLNVILDVLQRRHPHFEASVAAWAAVERGLLEGYLAAHSVTTLDYLLRRHLGSSTAQQAIADLVAMFHVAPVNREVVMQALALRWSDFEDAVQMSAALGVGADALVTRNPKDFRDHRIPVLTPAELPSLLFVPS